jgi:MFS-type transporter involved in bile tolerance (Atg22 family)
VFGLWWIDTASFALYVFSLSVLLQALVVISMSGAADHGPSPSSQTNVGSHRKNLLLMFAAVGSFACILFPAIGNGGALWAGLLAIVGNVSLHGIATDEGCLWGEFRLLECLFTALGAKSSFIKVGLGYFYASK